MSVKLATAYVDITTGTADLKPGLNRARGDINSFVQDAIGLLAQIQAAMVGLTLIRFASGLEAEAEQVRTAMNTIIKDVDRTNALLKELKEFSDITPFSPQAVTSTAKLLLAFGSSVGKVKDEIETLGDISAGSSSDIGSIALIFAQIRGEGKLLTQDYRQLATRGINLKDEIVKILGIQKNEFTSYMSAGKISFGTVQKAMENLTAEGGTFYGAMERQSVTLVGILGTLDGKWKTIAGNVGAKLNPAIKGLVNLLVKAADTFLALDTASGGMLSALAAGGLVIGTVTMGYVASVSALAKYRAMTGMAAQGAGQMAVAEGAKAVATGASTTALEGEIVVTAASMAQTELHTAALYRNTVARRGNSSAASSLTRAGLENQAMMIGSAMSAGTVSQALIGTTTAVSNYAGVTRNASNVIDGVVLSSKKYATTSSLLGRAVSSTGAKMMFLRSMTMGKLAVIIASIAAVAMLTMRLRGSSAEYAKLSKEMERNKKLNEDLIESDNKKTNKSMKAADEASGSDTKKAILLKAMVEQKKRIDSNATSLQRYQKAFDKLNTTTNSLSGNKFLATAKQDLELAKERTWALTDAMGELEAKLEQIDSSDRAAANAKKAGDEQFVKDEIAALQTKVKQLSLTEDQIKLMELADRGADDTQIKLAKSAMDAATAFEEKTKAAAKATEEAERAKKEEEREVERNEKTVMDLLRRGKEQITMFGKTANAVDLYRAKLAGATDQQLRMLKAQQRQVESLKKEEEMRKRAQGIIDGNKTAAEKYADELKEVAELVESGDLNKKEATRQVKKAKERLIQGVEGERKDRDQSQPLKVEFVGLQDFNSKIQDMLTTDDDKLDRQQLEKMALTAAASEGALDHLKEINKSFRNIGLAKD